MTSSYFCSVTRQGPQFAVDELRGKFNAVWFMLGIAAWLLIPPLRGTNSFIGWQPYWLIVAPALNLMACRWPSIVALMVFIAGGSNTGRSRRYVR